MKNLCTAMAKAFKEIEGATKAGTGNFGKYAALGNVIEAIKPPLIAHDLFFTQHPQPSADGVTVETVLHHSSGESISLGSLFVPANKKDAHGFGSALTYARRYALMTAFGVPAEDDDGTSAVRSMKADTGELVDDAQWAALVQMIEAKQADTQRFCKYLQVDSLKDLPASRFDAAMAALKAKPDPVNPAPKADPTPAKNPVLEPAK